MSCPDPPDLLNGSFNFTGNSVGDTATYSCDSDDFQLIGEETATCTLVSPSGAEFQPAERICRREFAVHNVCNSGTSDKGLLMTRSQRWSCSNDNKSSLLSFWALSIAVIFDLWPQQKLGRLGFQNLPGGGVFHGLEFKFNSLIPRPFREKLRAWYPVIAHAPNHV